MLPLCNTWCFRHHRTYLLQENQEHHQWKLNHRHVQELLQRHIPWLCQSQKTILLTSQNLHHSIRLLYIYIVFIFNLPLWLFYLHFFHHFPRTQCSLDYCATCLKIKSTAAYAIFHISLKWTQHDVMRLVTNLFEYRIARVDECLSFVLRNIY